MSRPKTRSQDSGWALRAALHFTLLVLFALTWSWHLTPQANKQEVAKKDGWFWNYLTFYSFTFQVVQWAVTLLADVSGNATLERLGNDVSCSVFGVATFVTICYYVMLFTGAIVNEKGVPAWVSPVLHTGNSIALWLDFYMCRRQRTFSGRALTISVVGVSCYLVWCHITRELNGEYPYAFMNDMEEPWGLVVFAVALECINLALFYAGSVLQRPILAANKKLT